MMILKHDQVPAHGIVRAYLTATAATPEDAAHGDGEHGWVDWDYSPRELFESRNDVRPIGEWSPSRGEGTAGGCFVDTDDVSGVADWMDYVLTDTFGTIGWDDNGDGTFYGADALVTDWTDPRSYTYAVHFHVKHFDSQRGWVEDEVSL